MALKTSTPFRRRSLRQQKWEQKNGKYQPVLLEEHVLREIVERLWLQARIKVWRINQPVGGKVRQNEPGISDLIGFIPFDPHLDPSIAQGNRPIPVFIEVKRPGGARRPAQTQFIEECARGGCAAFFAESWGDVIREMWKFGVQLKGGQ